MLCRGEGQAHGTCKKVGKGQLLPTRRLAILSNLVGLMTLMIIAD